MVVVQVIILRTQMTMLLIEFGVSAVSLVVKGKLCEKRIVIILVFKCWFAGI
ncbi:unnamed protein product [Trichobilharzia regenti]|nr:unnamed protein product [Trichobilharzia regenti]